MKPGRPAAAVRLVVRHAAGDAGRAHGGYLEPLPSPRKGDEEQRKRGRKRKRRRKEERREKEHKKGRNGNVPLLTFFEPSLKLHGAMKFSNPTSISSSSFLPSFLRFLQLLLLLLLLVLFIPPFPPSGSTALSLALLTTRSSSGSLSWWRTPR